jgi:tetrahydromethanopterin S-methyltransferase subunit B
MTDLSQSSCIVRDVQRDYVLERLADIRQSVADLLESVDPPWTEPEIEPPLGGVSAISAIADATYEAEAKWLR